LTGVLGNAWPVASDDERERLAATFNQAADLYQRARPEYPSELYDRLLAITRLPPGARLLEVGCATGKATLPLARRGFPITCLEPGAALAATARANLVGFDVEVVETRLEDWTGAGAPFAMVFAATAWHWVDPAVRYRAAARLLEPHGHLAVWGASHVIPNDGAPVLRRASGGVRRDRRVAPNRRDVSRDRKSWLTTATTSKPAGSSR
jgi:SAM-dependent methyltransferase